MFRQMKFKKVLSIINKIMNKTKIDFKFIDLGGGMGISYSNNEKKLFNISLSSILSNKSLL